MKNRVSRAEGIPSAPPSMPPEKRGVRLHKWHIISLVLALVVILQLILYVNLNFRYDSLSSKYRALETQHNSLQTQYNELEITHDSLQSQYSRLSSNYNKVKNQYDDFSSGYDHLRYEVNQRCLHLNTSKFVTPDDASVKQIVLEVTGGWSNPSDWNEYWDDVKDLYDWVVNNIEYRSDGLYPVLPVDPSLGINYEAEMWQFPNETLDIRKGDCEDMAILLASMIRNYGAENYWIECIAIQGSLGGHAAVQLPVSENKIAILDPAGNYYTSDAWGNLDQKDLSTEINDWLNYWKPDIGSDVCVERVFSNDLDKSFSSTNEYISWMSNR